MGGCVCDWKQYYVTYINSDATTFTCSLDPYRWSDGSYACGFSLYFLSNSFSVCSSCPNDPNAYTNSKGRCVCNSGYTWSEQTYPFKCVPGFSGGAYMSVPTPNNISYLLCSSLATTADQNGCLICSPLQGFLYLAGINQCLSCGSITGASGVATVSSCVCTTGNWNPVTYSCDTSVTCSPGFIYNPASQLCDICDPIRSVLISGTCTLCSGDLNSTGYAINSTTCSCPPSFVWTLSGNTGSCTSSTTCDNTTSIWIGSICFVCPSTSPGTGAPSDANNCGCNKNFTWEATTTGGSCVCSNPGQIIINDTCFSCPSGTNTTGQIDNKGGCLCLNNYVWDPINSMDCICDLTVNGIISPSGSCLVCSNATDPNLDGTITNGMCNCKNGFIFITSQTGGSCVCNPPNIVANGVCFFCPTNDNTTGAPAIGGPGCGCFNNFVWNTTLQTCLCDATLNSAYITLSGNCFQCLSFNDPNFDGTIVNNV